MTIDLQDAIDADRAVLRYERLRDDAMVSARKYPESRVAFVAAARVWNHRAIDERTGRLCITPIANGHCPECGDYAHACVCAEIDEGHATEILADYPCYACGAESTHEIQHRGGWLYVCDDPACVGEPEFWSWEEQAADDAGMRCRGEI